MTIMDKVPAKVKVWGRGFAWGVAILAVGQIAEAPGDPWKGYALLYVIPFLTGLAKTTPQSTLLPGTPTNRREDIYKPGVIEGTRGEVDAAPPEGRQGKPFTKGRL